MAESLEVVTFPGGRIARLARVADPARLPAMLFALGLVPPRPVLVLVGGAAGLALEQETASPLRDLFHTLARAAEAVGAVVVDGGTDAGVMALMGQARTETDSDFPLLGVAAEGTVVIPNLSSQLPGSGPGSMSTLSERAPLEPHHTHFLLIPGDRWGDEVPWIAGVATLLAGGAPSATVLVNGGEIARQDVAHSLAAGRPVVVVAGTGRLADELAATSEQSPLLQAVDLAAEPEAVTTCLRAMLEAG